MAVMSSSWMKRRDSHPHLGREAGMRSSLPKLSSMFYDVNRYSTSLMFERDTRT